MKINSIFEFKKVILMLLLFIITFLMGINQALAQTPASPLDPFSWQDGATGLRISSNPDKKTGGLSIQVKVPDVSSWPFLLLQGGVRDGGWGKIIGTINIELGTIKAPSVPSVTSVTETADWASDQLNFNANQLQLWVSRLSSAVLLSSSTNSLRMFSGSLASYSFNGTVVTNKTPAPSYPKYVAYPAQTGVEVRALSSSALPLSSGDQNQKWILLWYGNNSHFVETKAPLTYGSGGAGGVSLPHNLSYQADAPLLLVFQNNPASIAHSPEGGIDFNFAASGGYISVMPLFGRDHLKASDTESWGTNSALPQIVIDKINFWASRSCNYPQTVRESYSYDPASDSATITENITFIPVCSSTSTFAIIPPFLTVAKDALGVNFSHSLVDSGLYTEFGPTLGIENTNAYSWSVSGLKKYSDNDRILTNTGTVPQELLTDLTVQVEKVISDGHYAPWIFADHIPKEIVLGDIYWMNPADIIIQLAEIIPVVPEPQKTGLINYLKSERLNYPPETVANLDLEQGRVRKDYQISDRNSINLWKSQRGALFLKRVPLYNFYSLSRYYQTTGETPAGSVVTAAQAALNNDLKEIDWASMYWFKGFEDRPIAVVNANRFFAGLIGTSILASKAGDQETENLARALMAKAAALRVAMGQYSKYLHTKSLTVLPPQANWQMTTTAGIWTGYIFNNSWTSYLDDARQMGTLDQFEAYLYDSSGARTYLNTTNASLIGYRDLIPELARMLSDVSKEEAEIYVEKYETVFPHWYMPFADSLLGVEHDLSHPIDSYQTFLAKAWIQKETPDKLTRYSAYPWLSSGDLFYMHKLAETIKAYQGWKWEDEDIGVGIPGDVNNDAQVDVLDIQACVNYILGGRPEPGNNPDVNGDGSVNVLDVQNIVNIILGV